MCSARGLLSGAALTETYYSDARLRRWVRDLAARRPLAGVFAFSSSMCQYADSVQLSAGAIRVADFCDVDSDKWRQYALQMTSPLRALYEREARALSAAEVRYVRHFDATFVVSEVEAQILRRSVAENASGIHVLPNGVDTVYFDPSREYPSPFQIGTRPVVFTGAMDYHPNIDGVRWFANDVLPAIRRQRPDAVFWIVGSSPAAPVRQLGELPGVVVTGRVPDVRPYLAHAAVVVAPLRIARGVQNKVLEALSMARPVLGTRNALQGIPDADLSGALAVDEAGPMAEAVTNLLYGADVGRSGRSFVEQRFAWSSHTGKLTDLFREHSGGRGSVAAA
jgi:sugar transferase (PEP-CTERM/EpsH1 system associated)